MVAHTHGGARPRPSTWEAETGRSPSSMTAWSREQVLGQSGLHRETLPQKTKMKERKTEKKREAVGLGI